MRNARTNWISSFAILGCLVLPVSIGDGFSSSALAQAGNDAYCHSYARDVSYRYSRGGAVGGVVRGGAGGAVVGGIVNGGKGARKGAAIGATVGGVTRGVQRSVSYDQLYRDCMRGYIRY